MSEKLLWHRRSARHQRAVLEGRKPGIVTVADLVARYEQPEWCNYPGALESVMGCWSLMMLPSRIHGPHDCDGCELSKHYTGEAPAYDDRV